MNESDHNKQIVILDIRDSPWFDGPGRTVVEVASGLKSRGIKIIVASFVSESGKESDYLNKAREREVDCLEIKQSKRVDFSIIAQVLEVNKQTPIDIIHTHDPRSSIYGFIAARKLRLPIVATLHGWVENSLKRRLFMFFVNLLLSYFFNTVIAVSDKIQERFKKYHPTSKLVTIHNTLDTRKYKITNSDAIRRSLNIDNKIPLIGKIGRLSMEKRQERLILAVKKLVDEGYVFRLLLIGIGPDEEKLRQLTKELGLTEIISFLGFIEDMLPVYSELDLVVQNSSTEGLPNVILESMLMRVPVIATDVGGTSEVINSDDLGTLIEPDNEEMLVSALKSFLDSPESYRQKLDKAEQRIRQYFDSDVRLEKMASLYQEMVNR
ncbi:MAG: glycosyltransferase family 4 protein [Candidatus Thiodiazotropha sp.]|jgi:glycosyltransferase involved in cell wall biosynthesis